MLEYCSMLVDTHAHLMDAAYADDLPAVLDRATAADVSTIVCVGYDLASSRAAVGLASRHPGLFATVGVHPNYLAEAPADWLRELRALAASPRVVGIGEIGLDYYRTYTPGAAQREGFGAQLALAAELDLPVVIHCRDAEVDLIRTLEDRPAIKSSAGIWHCFSGSEAAMRAAVRQGYYISFAGTVTFKNAGALRAVAEQVPDERLLLETDSPDLSPSPHRGQRNEPARVRLTAELVADLRQTTLGELADQTTMNATRLFRWKSEAIG
jgi:TatD DNase family protein